MSSPFIADPPLPVTRRDLKRHLWQALVRLRFIVWQILAPFNSRPEEIPPLPEPVLEIDDKQMEQCLWLFEQAEKRRTYLEQKAQSTFGLMTFLVPLLASLFVFVISKAAVSAAGSRFVAMTLLTVSACQLLLGFVSALRAVAVKTIETLYLHSVVDEAGQFRHYDKAFRARGMLWCTAMNEAMNDHLAQFVKGAHILTAGAVITLAIAALPTGFMLSTLPSTPAQTKVVGTVDISSKELSSLRDEIGSLKKDVENLSRNGVSPAETKSLQKKRPRSIPR